MNKESIAQDIVKKEKHETFMIGFVAFFLLGFVSVAFFGMCMIESNVLYLVLSAAVMIFAISMMLGYIRDCYLITKSFQSQNYTYEKLPISRTCNARSGLYFYADYNGKEIYVSADIEDRQATHLHVIDFGNNLIRAVPVKMQCK